MLFWQSCKRIWSIKIGENDHGWVNNEIHPIVAVCALY